MVKSKVKYIQSLSQKKQRDEDGVFVAEGPKIINELLSEPGLRLHEVYGIREWIDNIVALHGNIDSSSIFEIDQQTLERISFLTTPNQVLGIFKKPSSQPLVLKDRISVMVDNIQDPGNLGSIIRCADWFGVSQVICSRDSADVYGPKTVQSTMGSIARVNVVYEDLASVIVGNPGIIVYAATLSGKNILEIPPINEGIILIGNESRGISRNLIELAREKITIPEERKC
jgi:TrmH family RNA methyltransferase